MQLQVEKILVAKPQLALEKFTIKTANGESQLNVVMGLAKPTSFEQPPADVTKQMLTALDAEVSASADDCRFVSGAGTVGWPDRSASHCQDGQHEQRDGRRDGGANRAGQSGGQQHPGFAQLR